MLAPAPGSLQIDATVGGGGHTERILEASSPDGRLLGLDADGAAIARVRERLARFGDRLVLRQANFRELGEVAPRAGFDQVDGLLFDLGLSSFQLADEERGFSFRSGGRLDMRFDTSRGTPAADLLASLDTAELAALFRALRRGAIRRSNCPRDRRRARDQPDRDGRRAGRPRGAQRPRHSAGPAQGPPRDARVPGTSDCRQCRARRPRGGPGERHRAAPTGWPARRPELPLAGGPHRQALHRGRAARLHVPARAARLRLRPEASPSPRRAKGHPSPRPTPRSPPTRARAVPGCAPRSGSPPESTATGSPADRPSEPRRSPR